MIPSVNRRLKKFLKPYRDHCKSIRARGLDVFTEDFLCDSIGLFYEHEHQEKTIKKNELILKIINSPKDYGINDIKIQQAKKIPIATLYDFEKVRTGRERFTACCPHPAHNDKNPSFTVYNSNTFHCFSCGFSGDTISLVMGVYGFKFVDAVNYLIKQL